MTPDTHSPPPLFVDLDGTLIKTDLLMESTLLLIKQSPWIVFSLPFWLLKGKSYLKARIAERVSMEADTFPLQAEFVAFLQEQHASGRELHLATASDIRLAQPVADRLGIFTSVLASDGIHNLRSEAKLAAIQKLTNGGPFDYAGNAKADFAVWDKARQAIVVNPGAGVESGARKRTHVAQVFDDRPPAWRVWVKETRLYQWMKNLLIGVPLLTAHAFNGGSVLAIVKAFIAFGLVASATYLLNDLLDLASDRRHPRKCRRPFAAGNLGIAKGSIGMGLMLIAGLATASCISPLFLMSLLSYLVITLSYSLYFKSYVLIDVLLLASLYTVRIIAGAIAIQVEVSSWLLAFSMFTFLSLALVKRSSELVAMEKLSRAGAKGRDYQLGDNQIISSMGTAAGYLAVLVLALYVDNPAIQHQYQHPRRLWLLCPLMLYWVSRLWIKTTRGEMDDDPLVFSLKDKGSWWIFSGMIAVTLASI
ncbi:UbiA family prenyltransferase [Undibacterium terreum]|uniref:Membrane protein n=1 Tax=Undibacterium terreum TaxID=1224302 RepID=A0A916XQY5_9BURK|nr:UbiA family prenyltransferase [Undibacterium terreum]GGC97037.1 membrane protein [Undibacterium terreum]